MTDFKDVRVKIVRDYKLFYRTNNDRVEIIRVWNTPRDTDLLQL